ncbi:MAG TPA: hypothetical protein PL029_00735 [Bacteroidia bacterium]|nr:hypothetical protein [Bacteroidia bacterium]
MRKILCVYLFIWFNAAAQTHSTPVDQWTNKTTHKLADSSLAFTNKNIVLHFDKTALCQLIDLITIQLNNQQTITELKIVKTYLEKRTQLYLSAGEREKRLKPDHAIHQGDSLTLTYFYFDALACELLVLNNCKITLDNKIQKSYKIHTFGTTENAVATYHLDNGTIFWKSSDAIKARE